MNREQYQFHLAETMQDLTDRELAVMYEDYIDDATVSLMNGLVTECQRRGISLNDLEDILIND
ncbi:MAG: hypothetical protein CL831_00570 [Crocinitomicaceae bacterium]|nr:hypothetical protein [Crocinitomicaceae bacterium]|tara:strand:- start:26759 stop:26947 length:189 start_codon:yes stop_codon:yes gene_type:complete